jgi:hypothetical protein
MCSCPGCRFDTNSHGMLSLSSNLQSFIDKADDTLAIGGYMQKFDKVASLTAIILLFQARIGMGWLGVISKSVATHVVAVDILTAGSNITVVSAADKTYCKSLVKPEYATIERLPEEVQVQTLIHYTACVSAASTGDSIKVDANRTLKIVLLPVFFPFALVVRRIAAYKLAELVAVDASSSLCVEIMQDYSKKIAPLKIATKRFVDAAAGLQDSSPVASIVKEVELFHTSARSSVVEVLATTCSNHMKILNDLSKTNELSEITKAANDTKALTEASAKKVFAKFKNQNVKLFNKQFRLFKDAFLPALSSFHTDLNLSDDTEAWAEFTEAWAEFNSSWADSWADAKKTMAALAVMQAVTKPAGDGFSKKEFLDAAQTVVDDLGEIISDSMKVHIENCQK